MFISKSGVATAWLCYTQGTSFYLSKGKRHDFDYAGRLMQTLPNSHLLKDLKELNCGSSLWGYSILSWTHHAVWTWTLQCMVVGALPFLPAINSVRGLEFFVGIGRRLRDFVA